MPSLEKPRDTDNSKNLEYLKKQFTEVRNRTVEICKPLNPEDFVVQVVPFASPAKWHLAHTTWFFETFVLKEYLENYKEFNPHYNFLFNSYYNNLGDRVIRTNRGNLTRPVIEKIFEYRAYVDKKLMELLEDSTQKSLLELIILGLNHEQQHQELLLTDLKYMFGHNPIFPIYNKNSNLVEDRNLLFGEARIPAGNYTIGHQESSFCYDNELNVHTVYLNDFEILKTLVTNGEFIEFIEDGGYSNFNHWLDEGWSWVQNEQIDSPLYWHKIKGKWHYYTLAGLKMVDESAVLSHVSFFEANAFAEWKKMRLPTEFEWEVAAAKFDWGKRWEGTNSAYLPYPKFKKAEGIRLVK